MASGSETGIGRRAIALRATLVRFQSCTSGATAIEYAMVAALFALATISSWRMVGTSLGRIYTTIANGVASVN